MGEAATRVQEALCEALRSADDGTPWRWALEHDVGGTPVDVAGLPVGEGTGSDEPSGGCLALCELEWRRADPSDNAAKLFRHLVDGALDGYDEVRVAQVFTGYYDLANGGVSAKRSNAEFVGHRIAASVDHVAYRPFTLAVSPPKRGAPLPEGWTRAVETTTTELLSFYAGVSDPGGEARTGRKG